MDAARRTPLFAAHERRGARLTPFAGYLLPVQYAGILAEHRAVREQCGVFDICHMGHALARDATLSRLLSRPLAAIPEGHSRYFLLMNAQGGIIDDCMGYRLEPNLWHIVLNAARKDVDVATMKNVEPRFELAMIALQGPRALGLVGEFCARRRCARNLTVLGVPVILAARTGYTGEDGYEFILAPEHAESLWEKLIAAGAAPCGLGARDLLRLEAALPLYGSDLDETTTPFETGLGFAVEAEREDFIARAALAAPPRRRRAGLTTARGAVPRHGCAVLDAVGKEIGVVTSGSFSPLVDRGIALTLVGAETRPVAIRIRDRAVPAAEVKLPFYRPPKPAAAPAEKT